MPNFFKQVCFPLLLLTVFISSGISNNALEKLPFCDNSDASQLLKSLVFVSTLDGRVSALNVDSGGAEKWTVPTGPMLSSSIHNLELTNQGQFVRMIPSLSGGLYKFNGETVEPIPITADHLLKSSFLFSDEIVISGGRESQTFGVDVNTGQVLYTCSMSKCDNRSRGEVSGDVVIIQRQTQTVRAIEPRSGAERWNFSVGQHEMKLAPDPATYCQVKTDLSDIQLKVIVPDGLVCALSKSKPGTVVWKHKFENPIVSAWQVINGKMEWVDLFGGQQFVSDEALPKSPLLYIGMHNKQLYIQESVNLQRKILESVKTNLLADASFIPRIPWRPVSASGYLGIEGPKEPLQITDEKAHTKTTALSVLYASEYVNGNGFFLYAIEEEKKEKGLCTDNDKLNITITLNANESIEDDDEDGVVEIYEEGAPIEVIVSFWFWWKEVLLTSISIAVLLNLIIQRRLILFLRGNRSESREPLVEGPIFEAGHSRNNSGSLNLKLPATPGDYISRYLTDFEPIHCLGKGGFGVVFQAKNKIDDCHYAIKRIPLPNKEESREKVMREVKALAKLDHQNIVRYFNAWLECPPPNWQEEQDAIWANAHRDELLSGAVLVDLSSQLTPSSEVPPAIPINRKKQNTMKSIWERASSFCPSGSELEESVGQLPITEPPPLNNEQSDSYIVFEGSKVEEEPTQDDPGEDFPSHDTGITTCTRPSSLNLSPCQSDQKNPRSLRMYLFIQMQLCKKESLKDWLSDNLCRNKKDIMNIFDQIVQAVEYVHLQGLIHRDLKPSNIFFSPDGQVKIGDFGLVTAMAEGDDFRTPPVGRKVTDERHTARVGTQLYMSPEQISGQQYNYKVDIFSLGVILFEMLLPFNTQMERWRTLMQVRENKFPPDFDKQFPDEYKLLRLMLAHNPEERLTTFGVRKRPPLRELQPDSSLSGEWEYALPVRQRDQSFSRSSSESTSSIS